MMVQYAPSGEEVDRLLANAVLDPAMIDCEEQRVLNGETPSPLCFQSDGSRALLMIDAEGQQGVGVCFVAAAIDYGCLLYSFTQDQVDEGIISDLIDMLAEFGWTLKPWADFVAAHKEDIKAMRRTTAFAMMPYEGCA